MNRRYLALIFIFIAMIFASCNHYDNEGDGVYYKSWNEGTGSSIRTLYGVNPKKFRVLKNDDYAKDDHLVFYKGDSVKGADAKTFQSLGDFYARDKFRGYYGKDSIKSSRGRTFKIIDSYYSTDGNDIFYDTIPLKVVSTKNFRYVFWTGESDYQRWTTDGKYYYYTSYKVPSDDYKNMVLYKNSGGISKDSKWAFYLNHKLNYNQNGKRIVDTIDVASFKVTGFIECHDKYGCISVEGGRENCEPGK
ncbi:MAG: DKNYY domain-containing protein [Mucilaginibacter sp.]